MARQRQVRAAANRRPPRGSPPADGPRPDRIALVLIAVAALLPYAGSLGAGFVVDNRPLILQDPRVQAATWDNVRSIFAHSYWWPIGEHGLYRPLTKLSYLFNYAVLGGAAHPEGYHVVNLALHLGNALLVYALALRLVRRARAAVAIAAVWAAHPVLTEAVTNIIGRADELAAMGVLGGLYCYLRSLDASGGRRALWLAGVAGAACAGIGSKESAVALPAVIGVHAFLWRDRPFRWRPIVAALTAVAAPFAAFVWARAAVLAQAPAAEFHFVDNPIVGAPFLLGRLTAIRVIARYLGLLVWPAALSTDYSYAQIPVSTGGIADWATAAALTAMVAAAIWLARRRRPALFFAGLAIVAFAPVSNLLFATGTIMAERLLYLPSIGVVACAVLAMESAAKRGPRWLPALGVSAVVLALGGRTWQRNRDWRDDVSIWTSAVRAAPDSFETHRGLAVSLASADSTGSDLPDVVAEMNRSLAILDRLPDRLNASDAYADAGFYYEQLGDRLARAGALGTSGPPGASLAAYRQSREILLRGVSIDRALSDEYTRQEAARGRDPSTVAPVGLPVLYERLAVTQLRLGETDLAVQAARHARMLEPLLPDSHDALAWVLANAGRPGEAAVALMTYFVMTGDRATVSSLQALYRQGLDKGRCAVSDGPGGPVLNTACPLVRDELCRASGEAAGIYIDNRRPDLAAELRRRATQSWGCTADGTAPGSLR